VRIREDEHVAALDLTRDLQSSYVMPSFAKSSRISWRLPAAPALRCSLFNQARSISGRSHRRSNRSTSLPRFASTDCAGAVQGNLASSFRYHPSRMVGVAGSLIREIISGEAA
jgi:hypothetical protein